MATTMIVIQKMFVVFSMGIILLNHVKGQSCPKTPCGKVPKIGADSQITITLYYNTMEGNAKTIYDNVCKLNKAWGNRVYMALKPGAGLSINSDNTINCGNYCEKARTEACYIQEDPIYATGCVEPEVDAAKIKDCVSNKKADQILINNVKELASKKISTSCVPTVLFQGYYDPCATPLDYNALFAYVCNLYDKKLNFCKLPPK